MGSPPSDLAGENSSPNVAHASLLTWLCCSRPRGHETRCSPRARGGHAGGPRFGVRGRRRLLRHSAKREKATPCVGGPSRSGELGRPLRPFPGRWPRRIGGAGHCAGEERRGAGVLGRGQLDFVKSNAGFLCYAWFGLSFEPLTDVIGVKLVSGAHIRM